MSFIERFFSIVLYRRYSIFTKVIGIGTAGKYFTALFCIRFAEASLWIH